MFPIGAVVVFLGLEVVVNVVVFSDDYFFAPRDGCVHCMCVCE